MPGLAFAYLELGWGELTPLAVVLVLVSASLLSSANYVLNELLDAESDRHHPTKRSRPIASGRISGGSIYVVYLALAGCGLSAAAAVNRSVLIVGISFLLAAVLYNARPVRLKDVVIVDVLWESANMIFRLLLGWLTVQPGTLPAPELIVAYWMLGAGLMARKRVLELREFPSAREAGMYRATFRYYDARGLAAMTVAFGGAFLALFARYLVLRG